MTEAFCVFVAGQLVARTGSYKYLIVGGFTFWCVCWSRLLLRI
jgi:hypothetical protein